MDLNAARRQLLVGIASERFAEFRPHHGTRMHEDQPEHLRSEMGVKGQRFAEKIIHAGDGLYPGEPATRDDKRE